MFCHHIERCEMRRIIVKARRLKRSDTLYTPNHTWARITEDKTVKAGISRYAVDCIKRNERMGIGFCRTEPVGAEVDRMEPFGIVETFRSVIDLFSPVSGRIKSVNSRVIKEPYILNENPEETWIVEIEPSNLEEEARLLLTPDLYDKICKKLLVTPELLLYTPKHTWARVTPEGNIRVGLSDYAQRHLKGIAYIMTEAEGKEISKMEPFGVAETWMFMFDLYAPVSGKIVKINRKLKNEPSLINEDPYGEGWIIEIKPKNSLTLEQELKSLLSAREYNKMVSRLEGRLRE